MEKKEKTLQDVQVGDQVIKNVRFTYYTPEIVTKVTPKYLYLGEEKFRKQDGSIMGTTDLCLVEIPNENNQRIIQKKEVVILLRELSYYPQSKLNSLTTEELKDIANNLQSIIDKVKKT